MLRPSLVFVCVGDAVVFAFPSDRRIYVCGEPALAFLQAEASPLPPAPASELQAFGFFAIAIR
jgi:hypothetical protein